MANIKRYLKEIISRNLEKRKIVLVYGARQVGKTTLVREFLSSGKTLYLNGDFIDDRQRLDTVTRSMVERFSGLDLLILDEAQNIPDIGVKLKVIHDTLPDMRIIATGSSSFDLSNKVSEPLTGRNVVFMMFPVSIGELSGNGTSLDDLLLYGSYPEVVLQADSQAKRDTIVRISESYLFKDVLNIEYIRSPKSLERLLKVMASQIGNEVSFLEIANTIDLDVKTVMVYLDILEKLFVIFPLHPLASTVRKSITKKRKYYFYDLGVRNAVLGDFSSLANRTDVGFLWENFVIMERMKRNERTGNRPEYFFFRSYKGEEIDFIEKYDDTLLGFECKYSKGVVVERIHKIFSDDLKGDGRVSVINRGNYEEFLR